MGKKAGKAFKVKHYKVPPEKFLVVVNPWGLFGNYVASDFNQIGAWFEIMLRDEYPDARVRAIFYQRTHRNIIVELPREVDDVEQYLGAHFYSKFLTNNPLHTGIAYIYEYRYANFGDPSDKNWSIGHPTYDRIPPDFSVKYPYPLSGPAPPPPMDCARPIPLEVNQRLAARLAGAFAPQPGPSTVSDSNQGPSSLANDSSLHRQPDTFRKDTPDKGKDRGKGKMLDILPPEPMDGHFTPYVPPSHITSQLKESIIDQHGASTTIAIKKMDPYEEAEVAEELLRSLSAVKKKEEADDFLSSFLPAVKTEEENPSIQLDDYKPSTELLDLFSTLPPGLSTGQLDFSPKQEDAKPFIKHEPVDTELPDYHPSGELLAAFAMLAPDTIYPGHKSTSIKSEMHDHIVKQELSDNFPSFNNPMDPRFIPSSAVDQERESKAELSRDPRIRARALTASLNKRDCNDVRDNVHGSRKRIKTEDFF